MKVILIGANGKMGKAMQGYLDKNGAEHIDIDVENREFVIDELFKDESHKDIDTIIDFSSSSCLKENLDLAEKIKVPIVIATTNHSAENIEYISSLSKKIPIFMSANFSLMFNVLLKSLKNFELLKNCDFALTETHHKTKKDSPSGSSKMIINKLNNMNINSIKLISIRAGEVVGEHDLKIYSSYEMLHLGHQAYNREAFCEGALMAAKFIKNKVDGLYSMEDLF